MNNPPPAELAWHADWIMPIMRALFAGDAAAAHAALEAARHAPRPAELSADFTRYIDYRWPYLALQVELEFPAAADPKLLLAQALAALNLPPAGAASARAQPRLRLQLHCIADHEGLAPLDGELFDELYRDVLAQSPNPELWFHATGWAFKRNRGDVISAALEYLTVSSARYFSDFLWQRVNLMHRLLEGRATKQDMLEMIKRVEHKNQCDSVERVLWQRCAAVGIVDDAVAAAWEQRKAKLAAQPRGLPQPQQRTRRLRSDL